MRPGSVPDGAGVGRPDSALEIPFIIQQRLNRLHDELVAVLLLENHHAALTKMQDIEHFLRECDLAFRIYLRDNGHGISP
jgi:hypothetical protein